MINRTPHRKCARVSFQEPTKVTLYQGSHSKSARFTRGNYSISGDRERVLPELSVKERKRSFFLFRGLSNSGQGYPDEEADCVTTPTVPETLGFPEVVHVPRIEIMTATKASFRPSLRQYPLRRQLTKSHVGQDERKRRHSGARATLFSGTDRRSVQRPWRVLWRKYFPLVRRDKV